MARRAATHLSVQQIASATSQPCRFYTARKHSVWVTQAVFAKDPDGSLLPVLLA